jgi:tRNA1(Val) A37 N6-methylase TrmN6
MAEGRETADPGTVSEDALLGGRVRFFQPAHGYRAAIDPVLLAAAVPASRGETVLDVGAGAGAAALCLAVRASGVRVQGIEADDALAGLARRNAEANGLAGRVTIVPGDLLDPPPELAPGSFDHVMANPPYLEPGRARPPPDEAKAATMVEGAAGLAHWLEFCLRMARPKGSVTVIHRADRLDEVLAGLRCALGAIVVFPLWPGPAEAGAAGSKAARRVVVHGRKGMATPLTLAGGLVLHGPDGSYTPEAEAILRHGRELEVSGRARHLDPDRREDDF